MAEFRCETVVAARPEVVFDLSRDIDFHQRSMAGSGERAVAGVTSGLIGLGESVTWKARHFGLPFTMTSKIVELERPYRFVDEQISGPFRSFRHLHTFTADEDTTLMVDEISYRAPLGPFGAVVDRLLLARYMRRLIELRNEALTQEAARPQPG